MVAPAARIFATASACRAAGFCAASHSGLPPPVRSPAMSYMSLMTAVSPASGPLAAPRIGALILCGTKKDSVTGLLLVPIENVHAIPRRHTRLAQHVLEGAADVVDPMRRPGQIAMHGDSHDLGTFY